MGGPRRVLAWLTVRLYRAALLRYPRRLRERWGDEMVEAARSLVEDETAAKGTLRGVGAAWGRLGRDLLRPVPRVREGEGRGTAGRGRPAEGSPDGEEAGMGRDAEGRGSRWAGVLEDLGFAWRSLRREPRFSLLMVSVLGAGIALNVAAFSVVRAYLLRPLPYPDADRVVQLRNGAGLGWRDAGEVLEAPVSWDLDVFVLLGDGRPELVRGSWITPAFQDLYGVQPRIGRRLSAEDAEPGRPPAALISHELWTRRFGGSPDVLGRSFRAFTSDRPDHAETFTVVGVLPEGFWHVNEFVHVLTPLRVDRTVYAGRLPASMPPEAAEAALMELARARVADLPDDAEIHVIRAQDWYTREVRSTLLSLQAAVLLVLLIACANAAVLLLIRTARRRRELGVRRALGAPTLRIGRQLLAEGLLLAGGAGALGTGLALLLLGSASGVLARTLVGVGVPGGAEALAVDGPVLAVGLAMVFGVGLVFGAVPLAAAGGGRGLQGLLSGRAGDGESRRRRRVRQGMVVAEVALSMALLAATGLMVRSAVHLNTRPLGFEPEGVVGAQVGLRQASYPEAADRVAFFERLLERVRALPEVEEAGLVGYPAFAGRPTPRRVESEPVGDGSTRLARVSATSQSPGYGEVLGIGRVEGRVFTPLDAAGSEPVVLVSESVAERLWPDGSAVGRRLRVLDHLAGTTSDTTVWRTVVGVVGDVADVPGSEVEGEVYLPFRQATGSWMVVTVRSRLGFRPTVERLGEVLASLDPELPLSSPYRLEDRVAEVRRPTAALAWILGGFSVFAGLLAVLGLYGVIAYAARQERRSLAIRMALGADRGRVRGRFVRQGMAVVALGLAAGLPLAVLLGRLLAGQLHGVTPRDPATHGGVAALLLLTAFVAVWIPARRAADAEPMGVLREE